MMLVCQWQQDAKTLISECFHCSTVDCGVTWKTTHLVLGKVDVHRQPHNKRSKTLIPHQCKDRKLINHLINYTCG